jgi:hypothetical protein
MESPKIVEVSIPDYTIESQPDYQSIGQRIDAVVEKNFEGRFLERALSLIDHPQLTLDQFVDIIVRDGTDKYDPSRKGVAHAEFAPYQADVQAGDIEIRDGKLTEPFGPTLVKLFYENVLLDRGYRLRLDLIVLYDPDQLTPATPVDDTQPRVSEHLESFLWRFKYPDNKAAAIKGIIKVLR